MGGNFRSDNAAGVAPEIMAALAAAGAGDGLAYGEDAWSQRLEARFSALFERECRVFPVATGTAANALALSAIAPPYGAIFVHPASHANTDECGAPEFYTGGAKLVPVEGAHGKIDASALAQRLSQAQRGVHWMPRAAVSISQVSEAGTVWRPEEVRAISAAARAHGLRLHMDGARFAGAVAATGCSPADLTWRSGVDILSFGATKGGAFAAEAVLVFDLGLAENLGYRRKRGGHLLSKMRLIAAQLEAYLEGGLWLRLAAQANAQAQRLGRALEGRKGVALLHPVEANMLFVALAEPVAAAIEAEGFRFYRWPSEDGRTVARLVTAFDTDPAAIDGFIAALDRHG